MIKWARRQAKSFIDVHCSHWMSLKCHKVRWAVMTPHYKLYVLRKGTLNSPKKLPSSSNSSVIFQGCSSCSAGHLERGYRKRLPVPVPRKCKRESDSMCSAKLGKKCQTETVLPILHYHYLNLLISYILDMPWADNSAVRLSRSLKLCWIESIS